jgi:hypothetical protein
MLMRARKIHTAQTEALRKTGSNAIGQFEKPSPFEHSPFFRESLPISSQEGKAYGEISPQGMPPPK